MLGQQADLGGGQGLTGDETCCGVVTIGLVLCNMPFDRRLLQLSDMSQPHGGGVQQAGCTVCIMLAQDIYFAGPSRALQVLNCIPSGTASHLLMLFTT